MLQYYSLDAYKHIPILVNHSFLIPENFSTKRDEYKLSKEINIELYMDQMFSPEGINIEI